MKANYSGLKLSTCALCSALLAAAVCVAGTAAYAADHGDAPLVSNDQGADIADVYAFIDPNQGPDGEKFLVTIITARGFITPGESENLGFFQDKLNWRFALETTGDANPDFNAEVTFSRRTDFRSPQTATIKLREGITPIITPFTAPTTPASSTSSVAPAMVVTTDSASGISVFAGMTDDPFFFDVPAELQFRDSLINSTPIPTGQTTAPDADPEVFDRSRDTFAGFNVMSVALRIPLSLIGGDNNFLGVSGYTEPTQFTFRSRRGGIRNIGGFVNVDRMGIPGVNTVLLPYLRKDVYNRSSTFQDASLAFAGDIVNSLVDLKTTGTLPTNPRCAFDRSGDCLPGDNNLGFLASLAVLNGDMLRLDTSTDNIGSQGGVNSGAGFPNGRRLADDPMDIIVNIIANQLFDPLGGIVDNVSQNDRNFSNTFPFLAPPHQPRDLAPRF